MNTFLRWKSCHTRPWSVDTWVTLTINLPPPLPKQILFLLPHELKCVWRINIGFYWYRRLLRGKGKPSPWLVLLELITLLSHAYQPVITGSLHKRSIGWKERPKDCLTTRVLSCDLTSRDSNSHVKHPARADRLSCELSCAWIFSHTTRIGQGAYRQVCSRARPLWSPCILAFVIPHFANY